MFPVLACSCYVVRHLRSPASSASRHVASFSRYTLNVHLQLVVRIKFLSSISVICLQNLSSSSSAQRTIHPQLHAWSFLHQCYRRLPPCPLHHTYRKALICPKSLLPAPSRSSSIMDCCFFAAMFNASSRDFPVSSHSDAVPFGQIPTGCHRAVVDEHDSHQLPDVS